MISLTDKANRNGKKEPNMKGILSMGLKMERDY